MRQLIATTKEGSETNKSLATGKKGSITTEQRRRVCWQIMRVWRRLRRVVRQLSSVWRRLRRVLWQLKAGSKSIIERLFKETVYLLAVHNFLNIHRCIYKISMVPTHACLNIEFASICHFMVWSVQKVDFTQEIFKIETLLSLTRNVF